MMTWLTYGLGWQWPALFAAGLLVAIAIPAVRVLGLSTGLRISAAIGAVMVLLLHGRRQRQQGWQDAQKQGKRDADTAIERARDARADAGRRDADPDRLRSDDGWRRD